VEKRADRKKGKKLWLKVTLAIIALLIIGVGIFAFTIYNNAKQTVNKKMHEPVDSIDTNVTIEKIKGSKPLHILLMGTDEREGDVGRSDAMMIMTLDPKNEQMKVLSIPRDTRTEIVGKGTEDKINHAYAFGGSDMSVATVENMFDMELDFYIRMNMEGLESVVDTLGGITVDNDYEWSEGEYDFPLGDVQMDGKKTMEFVRMRKQDPEGDAGRTKRQRMVLQGIIDKGAKVESVGNINGLIDILGNNMSTNMDFDDMKDLFKNYRDARKNVEEFSLEGEDTRIDGVYYLLVPDEEIQAARDRMMGVDEEE